MTDASPHCGPRSPRDERVRAHAATRRRRSPPSCATRLAAARARRPRAPPASATSRAASCSRATASTRLLDEGSPFLEVAPLAADGLYGGDAPGAGVIAGIGLVHGRHVMVVCNDATVKGGTYYPLTVKKHLRAQEIALENRLPCIYLVDSGGAFLPHAGRGLPRPRPLRPHLLQPGADVGGAASRRSRRCWARAPPAAPTCPAMSDETVIVRDQGTIFLGGPPLVKAATGEVVTAEELGGGELHARVSGVADHLAEDDEHALEIVRDIVATLPAPRAAGVGRRAEPRRPPSTQRELYGVVPVDVQQPYDVREVIARLVDGSEFHEFKARYGDDARHRLRAHRTGIPVGIVANNGVLFSESALKGAHFIELCDQRGIPLVFLQNITGFMVGRDVRGRRHREARREDGHRRRDDARAEAHGRHRRLVRRRQLLDVRPRLLARGSCGCGRTPASR